VVAVSVILEDRPGELGRVGAALAESRVDVRDLQLRHGRHGGGGVLTLSVRPGEAETLSGALVGQGFELA
jgi:prephenate dehydrogenase